MFICGEFIRGRGVLLASYDGEDIKFKLEEDPDFYYLRASKKEWEGFAAELKKINFKERPSSKKRRSFKKKKFG